MSTDYTAVRKWHKDTGSKDYYIDAQVAKAREDNAPADAIYWHIESQSWRTVRDLPVDNPFRLWYEGVTA